MAEITGNVNYLQPTGFKIIIERKRFPNFTFFAQTVTHPTLTVDAAEVPFRGIRSVPQPGDTLTFGELQMQAIIDEDMTSYIELYTWLKDMTTKNIVPESERSGGKYPTMADIQVCILNSKNNVTNTIRYLSAFPTSVGQINLESTIDIVTYPTFDVTFKFSEFTL